MGRDERGSFTLCLSPALLAQKSLDIFRVSCCNPQGPGRRGHLTKMVAWEGKAMGRE